MEWGMMVEKTDVVIIGGGPSGISAALWCKRLELNHVLLESNNQLGGQLFHIHNKIVDYPGLLVKNGEELRRLLEEQVGVMDCNIKLGCSIASIQSEQNQLQYVINGQKINLKFKYLIYATGSKPRSLGVSGEREMFLRGEVYSATRDKHLFNRKNVAVIGGGDRAFEGAFLLAEAGATVYLIHRSSHFRARNPYQQRVFNNKAINVLKNTTVLSINGSLQVNSVDIVNGEKKQRIVVDAVFIRLGVTPNTSLIVNQVRTDEAGYIEVNQFGETSVPTIFAIGDVCTQPQYSSISTSVGQAMVAVKQISERLKT